MLLDRATLELSPSAPKVLATLGDPRFKLELPASQLEILTPPEPTVAGAAASLARARRTLAAAAPELIVPAAAGVHPFSAGVGPLNDQPRYARTIERYGPVAPRQLVCALQVHVAVGPADRALAVYNAARAYLPLVAALAANAPYYEGADTGLASVRPKLCELLPRQGVPPSIASWEQHAETFRWGAASGGDPSPRTWWWELRPHVVYGTLEFRVPDAQSSVAEAAAIAAVIQSLVRWLSDRHEAGESLPVVSDWRIAENRWSACHDGVEGEMADLLAGGRRATRACLRELLDTLEPAARRLDCSRELDRARSMIEVNGTIAQRRAARAGGTRALASWLAERFLAD